MNTLPEITNVEVELSAITANSAYRSSMTACATTSIDQKTGTIKPVYVASNGSRCCIAICQGSEPAGQDRRS